MPALAIPETDSEIVELPIDRLRVDLMRSMRLMRKDEVRYLVDQYYSIQDFRMQTQGQIRASSVQGEPHNLISWQLKQLRVWESTIQAALDDYTDREVTGMGRWLKAIYGIGPVIAAGLLANIDIEKAPTAGNIWRFAGLDGRVKWQGSKVAGELMKTAFAVEATDVDAMLWLARATNHRVSDLYAASGTETVERLPALEAVLNAEGRDRTFKDVSELFELYPLHVDNAINRACLEWDILPADVYEPLYGNAEIDKDALRKMLAKRPWNARLKTLCWKIGQSFMKFSGREHCYYGKLYLQRKQDEVNLNEQGGYKQVAENALAAKNYRNDTKAKQTYVTGKLPPGHIDARARRWVVKLFLSHLHREWYRRHFGEEPARPYPMVFLGHAHEIGPPPNLPTE